VSVLDRKLLRELRASWLLLTAIVSIIAVGVACYVSMGGAYHNLTEAKRRYYRQCRMADFWIDLKKVPLAELDALAELPGVAAICPRIGFYATVDLEHVTKPLNGMVLSLPDRREAVINDVVIERGGYFTDRRENEVIVNEAFAAHHKLKPGDWIRLVLNNRRQELFIVGTAISSEFVYLLGPGAITPDPEHFGVFYLKQTYAEDVFDFDGAANQVVGRLASDVQQNPHELLDRAERLLSSYGVFTTTPLVDQASNKYLSEEIRGLRSFAFFLPAIFLAVAAMVLNVFLRRLAEQQRTVVGTLNALGYSDRQIFVHFVKFGLTVGLVGGLLGCVLGFWFADRMTTMYRQFFEFPELNNRLYPGLQSTGLLISLICAVLGSLQGTRAVLRLKPAEAMRPKPPKQGGAILVERVTWLWGRLSSGWRMVLRGVVRNRVRTLAGVFAASMGASVLVTGFMLAEASRYLVDFQFKWVLKSDIDLTFKDEQSEDVLLEAARLPGVDRAEPILNVACTFYNGPYRKKGTITGLAPDARLTVPRDLQARPIRVPSAGLAMSRKLAEVLHLKRGDRVAIRPIKGLRRTQAVPVLEISDSYLGMAVYTDIHYLGPYRCLAPRTEAIARTASSQRPGRHARKPGDNAGPGHVGLYRPVGGVCRGGLFRQHPQRLVDQPGRAATGGSHAPRARLRPLGNRQPAVAGEHDRYAGRHFAGNADWILARRGGLNDLRDRDVPISRRRHTPHLDLDPGAGGRVRASGPRRGANRRTPDGLAGGVAGEGVVGSREYGVESWDLLT